MLRSYVQRRLQTKETLMRGHFAPSNCHLRMEQKNSNIGCLRVMQTAIHGRPLSIVVRPRALRGIRAVGIAAVFVSCVLIIIFNVAQFFFHRPIISGLWPGLKGRGQRHQTDQAQPPPQRVAICLVGQARRFELTGPSLRQHLLGAYPHADVFVHASLDPTTARLTALTGVPNLATIRVFTPTPIKEEGAPQTVLTGANSPKGIQGLLQYFHLVEGCGALIRAYERRHSLHYHWILRTRLDSFWRGPPPPLETLDPKVYTVPPGSRYGGLNDRLGIGGPTASHVALYRLSMLRALKRRQLRGLNSEGALEAQLAVGNITVTSSAQIPFCVLSDRQYKWPLDQWSVPVASMASSAPLNGAKCRPCTPRATGKAAEEEIAKLDKDGGWPGVTLGVDLCDPSGPWEEGWQAIYDEMAGKEWADIRKSMSERSLDDCIAAYTELEEFGGYEGPPARTVCQLAEGVLM